MRLFRFGPRSASPFVLLDLEVGLERSDPEFPFLEEPMTSIRAIVAFSEVTGQPAIALSLTWVSQAPRRVVAFLQRLQQVGRPPPILAIIARLLVLYVTRTLPHPQSISSHFSTYRLKSLA